jgi:hypothetical protein
MRKNLFKVWNKNKFSLNNELILNIEKYDDNGKSAGKSAGIRVGDQVIWISCIFPKTYWKYADFFIGQVLRQTCYGHYPR